MLQFYDTKLVLSALAVAALGTPVMADVTPFADVTSCSLQDGYAVDVSAFRGEVGACLLEGDSFDTVEAAGRISTLSDRFRQQRNLAPLTGRDALALAAQAHAMDMAMNAYASHEDQLGRGHLDRIRMLDRRGLYGAAGANITIAPAGTSSIDVFNALLSDPINAENLTRDTFSHTGIGTAIGSDGQLYVVQVFAELVGELDSPMANELAQRQDLHMTLADTSLDYDGWRLRVINGNAASHGMGYAISRAILPDGMAGLEIELSNPMYTQILKGPIVSLP